MRQFATAGVLTSAVVALAGAVFVGAIGSPTPRLLGTGTITVDLAAPGAAIPPTLYGIFFEEINHAGDGGLYAELVRNRGLRGRQSPAGLRPRGQLHRPAAHAALRHRQTERLAAALGRHQSASGLVARPRPAAPHATIGSRRDRPLNDATPHSLAGRMSRRPRPADAPPW